MDPQHHAPQTTSHDPHHPNRGPRTRIGVVLTFLGATALTIGVTGSPVAGGVDTQKLPLGNSGAGTGQACPDDVNDYWHFVIAPNNGAYSFVTITLDLAGTIVPFGGAGIVPNGRQHDNVFVQVPTGATLGDLRAARSSADVSPSGGRPKFVLSHLCDGRGTGTTSTTPTSTSTSTSTSSSTSTSTTLPCEWNPQLPPDSPDCVEPTTTASPTTTSTTTSSSTTTLPCEWNPQLPPDSPDCVEPTTTSSTTTSTTTSNSTSSSTTTLPCEWNPQLPPDDTDCVEPTTTTSSTTTSTTTSTTNGHRGETISVVVPNDFAAISLDTSVDATVVEPGQELSYTLVAENTGALDLDPIVIFDRLPPEVVFLNAEVAGHAGTCAVIDVARPQLVRCDLDGVYAPGDTTPAITLLVQVDPGLTSAGSMLNQAQSIGVYGDSVVGDVTQSIGGVAGCSPTEAQVCDLSAEIGVTVEIPTRSTVQVAPPTTVGTGSNSPAPVLGQLPKTGSDSTGNLIAVGALLIMLGGVLTLCTRREFEVG